MYRSEDERLWFTLHANIGPILLCLWYRRPIPEVGSIQRFANEVDLLQTNAVGMLCIGDHNVHINPGLPIPKRIVRLVNF